MIVRDARVVHVWCRWDKDGGGSLNYKELQKILNSSTARSSMSNSGKQQWGTMKNATKAAKMIS